jgi:23S rRNA pseudouridine1911/1915/1917 synthase
MNYHHKSYIHFIGDVPLRVDLYIADRLQLLSRSQLKTRITSLTLDGLPVKMNHKVRMGQLIELTWTANPADHFTPKPMNLDILFENDDLWVINKPHGMVVHPGAGHYEDTLANGLAFLMSESQRKGFEQHRPGIVHRLDRETSGIIICAKHVKAHAFLADQFRQRTTKKRYLAVLGGQITPHTGIITNFVDRSRGNRKRFTCGPDPDRGRFASTGYRVLRSSSMGSLLLFKPYTGRTHQLRVHAKSMGYPIIGDTLYHSQPNNCERMLLHAWKLQIVLPNETEPRLFYAPVPKIFAQYLKLIKT